LLPRAFGLLLFPELGLCSSFIHPALLSGLLLQLSRDPALFPLTTPSGRAPPHAAVAAFAFWRASYIWASSDLRLGIAFSGRTEAQHARDRPHNSFY